MPVAIQRDQRTVRVKFLQESPTYWDDLMELKHIVKKKHLRYDQETGEWIVSWPEVYRYQLGYLDIAMKDFTAQLRMFTTGD